MTDVSITLGPRREVRLPQGTVTVREAGSGAAVVFVHGLLVNSDLWAETAARLLPHARVVLPDLPMGGHRMAMPAGADLSPAGQAELLADLLDVLDLTEVTLVGNDTGGAICQLLVTRRPERVARLVLTNCDAYAHFPPTVLRPLPALAGRAGPLLGRLLGWAARYGPVRRVMMASVQHRRPDSATLDSFFAPLADRGIQRDAVALLAGIRGEQLRQAAEKFASFRGPVLVAWGENDLLFPSADAERLARDFPDAELVVIPASRAFVPADQPARLADLLADFLHRRRGTVAAGPTTTSSAR